MIMQNVADEHLIEIAVASSEKEQNPVISFFLRTEFLSGTFCVDLKSAITFQFELDKAIKDAEEIIGRR